MKTFKTVLAVLVSLVLLSACGSLPDGSELDVNWKDNNDETEETSQGENPEGEESGDEDDDSSSGGRREGSDSSDGDDTSGGVEILEVGDGRLDDRCFMGTYTFLQNSYYNGFEICKHGFPLNVRLYSHDDVIDFESSTGDLFSIANLYEDDTFDFEVVFLDRFGDPSIDVACTCVIQDAYYDYRKERIGCGCEPSNDNENCSVIYEKLNFDDY